MMLPNNRLDFIQNISPEYIKKMEDVREIYKCLDYLIANQFPNYPLAQHKGETTEAQRCAQLARTHLEIALQYTIKTFCLLGEL